ncbi:hypothetical protein B8W86_09885 [Lactobacillus kefiranofaciens]|nr:helix-turn-helix domain-containing protein [Lactobacillus kefiranofaciens]PAK97481.1 hypothetical protein B8W86_09885 [Lactobacillus kefiranofaciens]QNT45115.1 helix-turn-helix domain-containing protein [Lactobacillus kefiranofaciens]
MNKEILSMKKKFFNPELNRYEYYTEVWLPEKVTVKDEKDLFVINHYWKDKDGELWGNFDNPMENVYRSFAAYRQKKGFLTPKQIRELRKDLNMSVREFANSLGISSSALTKIENNHRIQTKYQDMLFRLVMLNKSNFKKELANNDKKTWLDNLNQMIDKKYQRSDSRP